MSLPELDWQILYGRVAWALVLAALLGTLIERLRAAPSVRRAVLATMLLALALWSAAPGAAAPAYWLGLAFQLPSAWLSCLCAQRLLALWRGRAALPMPPLSAPVPLAAAIVAIGAALYLDAMGVLALGWYYLGFGPLGAPLAALALAALCVWGVLRGLYRAHALALLAALCIFAVLRLPSGNLWDALLDPFLVAWAVASLLAGWRRRARTRPHPA